MSSFTIYGVPGSPYVRIALLGLEEKGADYRLVPLAMGDHRKPEHLARQPFGRIPVMDHQDFRLYETQAILRYLDRIIPEPALTPTDPRAEARMNQLVGITDCYVMPDVSACISFQRLVAAKFDLPVDETKVSAAIPRAETCLNEIARLMGDRSFMAGDTISLADLMLAPHLAYFAATPEGRAMFARHPGLTAWVERMNERPSMTNTTWERLQTASHAA